MNISNQHTVLVPNMHLEAAQRVIREQQDKAVQGGWRPQAGQPKVEVTKDGDKTKLIFDLPDPQIAELKKHLDAIDHLITMLKDVGNFFEDVVRKLWPF